MHALPCVNARRNAGCRESFSPGSGGGGGLLPHQPHFSDLDEYSDSSFSPCSAAPRQPSGGPPASGGVVAVATRVVSRPGRLGASGEVRIPRPESYLRCQAPIDRARNDWSARDTGILRSSKVRRSRGRPSTVTAENFWAPTGPRTPTSSAEQPPHPRTQNSPVAGRTPGYCGGRLRAGLNPPPVRATRVRVGRVRHTVGLRRLPGSRAG